MTKSTNRNRKNAECVRGVLELVDWHGPDTIVFEDTLHDTCRRSKRVARLLYLLNEKMKPRRVKVAKYSRADVLLTFSQIAKKNKHEIACAVARHFPELERHLPAKRRPWEAESPKMSIFEAAAFALTHYSSTDYLMQEMISF